MRYKRLNSTILITLTLLGTIFIMIGFVPNLPHVPPILPNVHASPPNNPATLGIFSEVKRSNAFVDATILANQFFKMDINITDGGLIKGFDVNITFASASIVYQNSSYTGAGCTSASGCIFAAPLTTIMSVNATTACKTPSPPCVATGNPNWYRLAVGDNDQGRPFLSGIGVMFRVTFKAVATGVASVIHFDISTTTVSNPGSVPYGAIDGYFDSRATASKSDFTVSESPRSVTITRWSYQAGVGGNTGSGQTTVSIGGLTNVGAVTYKPLSLPSYVTYSNTTNPCTTTCTSTLTFWVSGGSKGQLLEPVIYDVNNDGKYSHGKFFNDTLIAGTVPANNTAVLTDSTPFPSKVKFIGAAATWFLGNTVVYDSNGNGVYDAGEPVIFGSQPAAGVALKTDAKLKFEDNIIPDGVWDNGSTPSGNFQIPIIGTAGSTNGVLGSVVRVTWLILTVSPPAPPAFTFTATPSTVNIQAGANNASNIVTLTASLTSGSNDSISLSNNCNVTFGAGTCMIKSSSNLHFPISTTMNISTNVAYFQSGTQPWVFKANATATSAGTYSEQTIVQKAQITVNVYKSHDMRADLVKMSRDFSYSGTPLTTTSMLQVSVNVTNLGTVTQTGLNVNATAKTVLLTTPYPGTSVTLNWIDTGGNASAPYKSGEPVIQDNDGNGVYGYGLYDSSIRFAGSGSSWTPGNPVVYDPDGDGVYTVGKYSVNDTIIANGPIANNTALKTDFKLKFVGCTNTSLATPYCPNTGSLGSPVWTCLSTTLSGFVSTCTTAPQSCTGLAIPCTSETVAYDSNGNGVYDSGEPVIFGTAPPNEPVIFLTAPALATRVSQNTLSFVDQNYNGLLTSADPIASDQNGNGVYDAGEPIVRGTISAGILVGRVTVPSLAPNIKTTVTIPWDPSNLPRGRYIIAGWAEPVAGEYYVDNNIVLIQTFTQRLNGDVNGDCHVDVSDLGIVGAVFNQRRGDPRYNPFADINDDALIDVSDLGIVGANFAVPKNVC